MTSPSRRWRAVGLSAGNHEHEALEQIRTMVEDDPLFHAWTNLSIPDRRGSPTEIDLLVVSGSGVFVIELKGWHGQVSGRMYAWTRCIRGHDRPVSSPLCSTQNKARRLKTLLSDINEEQQTRAVLPWIRALVVMHGRNSKFDLDDRAIDGIYGLDDRQIVGLPAFSEFLHAPVARRDRLDKPAVDALLRLIKASGMEPVTEDRSDPDETADPQIPPPDVEPELDEGEDVRIDPRRLVPRLTAPLFAALTDEALADLGVSAVQLPHVRVVVEEIELIGLVDDETFDDLVAVVEGEVLDDVLERRALARQIYAHVDAQAAEAGPDTAAPSEQVTDPTPRRRRIFVATRRRREPKASKTSLFRRQPAEQPPARPVSSKGIPSETLLNIARNEALKRRADGARTLLAEVADHVLRLGTADWTRDEIDVLTQRLSPHTLLAQRLELLVASPPTPPQIIRKSSGAASAVGALWRGGMPGPGYSLLLRVPDVLDRADGIYLSQIVGERKAAQVNARLRRGRPDGGRIRISPDGTVVSRRNPHSEWFVVGTVQPDEWFTGPFVAARTHG